MSARYLLRLDDACDTMDGVRWQAMENLLDRLGIKPIVAVVPANVDPDLQREPPNPEFWYKVRSWRDKGWAIAMHGYQHLMHPTKSRLILPFYQRSEFGGLAYEVQASKIRKSWKLFLNQGVEPAIWVAPAHCFDLDTLKAVFNETRIRIISDGIARDHFFDSDFIWLPQQLWRLEEKATGLWTTCLHPNSISPEQLATLADKLQNRFLDRITSVDRLALTRRSKSLTDYLYDLYFWQRHKGQRLLQNVVSKLRSP